MLDEARLFPPGTEVGEGHLVHHLLHQEDSHSPAGTVVEVGLGIVTGKLARVERQPLLPNGHFDSVRKRMAEDVEGGCLIRLVGVLDHVGDGFLDDEVETVEVGFGASPGPRRLPDEHLGNRETGQVAGQGQLHRALLGHEHSYMLMGC